MATSETPCRSMRPAQRWRILANTGHEIVCCGAAESMWVRMRAVPCA